MDIYRNDNLDKNGCQLIPFVFIKVNHQIFQILK